MLPSSRRRPTIYLDNHATTRVDPAVVAAMAPYWEDDYGNAGSLEHGYGWSAEAAVEQARAQLALALGATAEEILFTSGATEANNLAIKGVATANRDRGNHLVTVATEHHAVLGPCQRLAREGFALTILPCDEQGHLSAEQVARALRPETLLVSVMLANNEIGTIQDLAPISDLCRRQGIPLHTDATQALGRLPLTGLADLVDLASLSAHKCHGPKGIGALYLQRRDPDRKVRLRPLLDGGGQEAGLRAGTLPVPLVVGFGQAAELARTTQAEAAPRMAQLRDLLEHQLRSRLSRPVIRNGDPQHSLPNNLNVSILGIDSSCLLRALTTLAISTGAACHTTQPTPSHVLRALGRDNDAIRSALRFGLSRYTTRAEIETAVDLIVAAIHQ